MITNLLATILVSVVTNWTDVHEKTWGTSMSPCGSGEWNGWYFNQPKGKYLGKDGVVVHITEIRFDYNGKPQVHRIEEPLEKITMRCREKEPELIWDEPKREKIGIVNITVTNKSARSKE